MRVALLSERFWHEIDGDTIATTIEEATDVFPRAAHIPLQGRIVQGQLVFSLPRIAPPL